MWGGGVASNSVQRWLKHDGIIAGFCPWQRRLTMAEPQLQAGAAGTGSTSYLLPDTSCKWCHRAAAIVVSARWPGGQGWVVVFYITVTRCSERPCKYTAICSRDEMERKLYCIFTLYGCIGSLQFNKFLTAGYFRQTESCCVHWRDICLGPFCWTLCQDEQQTVILWQGSALTWQLLPFIKVHKSVLAFICWKYENK